MIHIIVAGMCLFLIGANVAFLAHLRAQLMSWFNLKIVAVTVLLVYVSTSVFFGHPETCMLLLGLLATVLDSIALYKMWGSIIALKNQGIIGLVPLIRPRED